MYSIRDIDFGYDQCVMAVVFVAIWVICPKLWYAHVNDGKPVNFVEPHLEYETMFRPIAYGVLKCV